MKYLFVALCIIFFHSLFGNTEHLLCGIASGYPPYQYSDNEELKGIDYKIAKKISNEIDLEVRFVQGEWDSVLNQLRVGNLDIIVGMEVTDSREKLFLFSKILYYRKEVIFTLEDSNIEKLDDLYYQIISGDRDSKIELELQGKGIRERFRIKQTISKESSIIQLRDGKVKAVIMPKAVGLFLANKYNLKLKTIYEEEEGTPVAVAINKKSSYLKDIINSAIDKLILSNTLESIIIQ